MSEPEFHALMAESELPTSECTLELHRMYRGACYWCCSNCNLDTHRCPACGDDLRHDGRKSSGAFHPCLDPVCPECEQGKHENCTEWALDALDIERACACRTVDHNPRSTT